MQERLVDLECTLKSGDIYNERILELPKRKVAIPSLHPGMYAQITESKASSSADSDSAENTLTCR